MGILLLPSPSPQLTDIMVLCRALPAPRELTPLVARFVSPALYVCCNMWQLSEHDVNGFHHNPRYVADRVTTKQDYCTVVMSPVFVRLMSELAIHMPPSGKVQPFIVQVLSGSAPAPAAGTVPTSLSSPEAIAATKAYFAEFIDPLLQELARAVAQEEPKDVNDFLIELCNKQRLLPPPLRLPSRRRPPPRRQRRHALVQTRRPQRLVVHQLRWTVPRDPRPRRCATVCAWATSTSWCR